MSIKRKVLAAAGVLTLASGLCTVGAVAASAATRQCGGGCIEVYSMKYATPASLGFVETVFLGFRCKACRRRCARPAARTQPKISSSRRPAGCRYLSGMRPAWCRLR